MRLMQPELNKLGVTMFDNANQNRRRPTGLAIVAHELDLDVRELAEIIDRKARLELWDRLHCHVPGPVHRKMVLTSCDAGHIRLNEDAQIDQTVKT